MTTVVDASFILALLLDDERTAAIYRAAGTIFQAGATAPRHWHLEVANGVLIALRRRRIDASQADRALMQFAELDVAVDPDSSGAWTAIYRLAHRDDLTVYDAAYLELASRRGLPLASLDKRLVAAARGCGVAVVPV